MGFLERLRGGSAPWPQPPGVSGPASPIPAPPVAWSPEPASATAPGGRGLTALAGLLAIVGAALSVAGTLLPVTSWGDESQPPFTILPILAGSPTNPLNEFSWFALEPIGIAVVAALLGLALVLAGSPRRAGGGALLAFGLTTVLGFSAYVLSSAFTESFGTPYGPTPGPGSLLGVLSGLLLMLAGLLALLAVPRPAR